jgi:hypothetical protein
VAEFKAKLYVKLERHRVGRGWVLYRTTQELPVRNIYIERTALPTPLPKTVNVFVGWDHEEAQTVHPAA